MATKMTMKDVNARILHTGYRIMKPTRSTYRTETYCKYWLVGNGRKSGHDTILDAFVYAVRSHHEYFVVR